MNSHFISRSGTRQAPETPTDSLLPQKDRETAV
jgi:hypothetical protein